MNMSYCRFQNTRTDLRDCKDTLEGIIEGDPHDAELSREEFEAACNLISMAQDLIINLKEHAGRADDEELSLDDIRSLLNDAISEAKENEEPEQE